MSGERIIPQKIASIPEYYLYLKGVFLYNWCKDFIAPGGLCVDIGCGAGYGTSALASLGAKVIGLDVDKRAIAHAIKQYGGKGVEFKVYDGRRLPFEDNSVDCLLAMHVIEHIDDTYSFIQEVKRVLKKGSRFICVTPDKFLRLPQGMAPWNVHHKREYSFAEMQTLLKASFDDAAMHSVSAIKEVMDIEKERIDQSIRLARLDKFNLRRKAPASLMALAAKAYHFFKRIGKRPFGIPKGEAQDFYKVGEYIEGQALDLIGVCVKQ